MSNEIKDNQHSIFLKNVKFRNKIFSQYFLKYETSYPFSYNKLKVSLDEMLVKRKSKFLALYPYFMWFENMFELNMQVMDELLAANCSKIVDNSWKYYLAIIAAATYRSEYVLSYFQLEFLSNNGDINWLILGIKEVPDKLKVFGEINNILAHQPWKMEYKQIKLLLDSNWTKEELTEAILILTSVQKLALLEECMKISMFDENYKIEKIAELISNKNKVSNSLFDCIDSVNKSESDENGKKKII
jgi:hypothetical protein